VETVIGEGDFQEAVTLSVRHLEKVHGGVVHTHHQLHLLGFLWLEEIAMNGRGRQENTLAEIEIVTWRIVVEVRIETKEPAQAHEEYEMKVGKAVVLAIEPLDAVDDIVEKKGVLLLSAQGIVEELSHKEGDRELVLAKGNGGEGMKQTGIGELLQLQARPHISLNLQHGQRLEKLFLDLPLGRLRQADDKRESTVATGEHIDDESRLSVLQRVQHYGRGLSQHTSAKIRRRVES